MHTADVVVAGGGSAGLAAALAAARAGIDTLLLDRQAQLGGMGTQALVHTFCGLYHPDVSQGPRWLNPGIATEIGQHILERTGQKKPDLMGRVYVLRQHPSIFAQLADELLQREPNLRVWSGAEWVGLKSCGQGWTLDLMARGVPHQIQCRALVDTTGDATGARLFDTSLAEQAPAAQLYRPAYITVFHGMNADADEGWRLNLGATIVRAVRDGHLPATTLGAGFRASPFAGELFLTIDLEAGQGDWDPADPAKRAGVEAEGRAAALALWQFLRQYHADFADCPPPTLPAQPGIRESARYKGDHTLTGDELAACTRFDDCVALAGWPMEKRETARGPKFRFFDRAEPAEIPARCLKTETHPGLFFAGRCLSADHDALASVRVMGTCLATGEAAGQMAAAFARSARG